MRVCAHAHVEAIIIETIKINSKALLKSVWLLRFLNLWTLKNVNSIMYVWWTEESETFLH